MAITVRLGVKIRMGADRNGRLFGRERWALLQRGSGTVISQRVNSSSEVGCELVNGKRIAKGFVTVPVERFEIQREGRYPQFIVSASEAKIEAKIA